MDIRQFESFQLQDAIKLVKSELGREAIIISTREKEVYSKELGKNVKMYEVTAAANATENKKVISSKIGEHLQKVDFPRIASKNETVVVKGPAIKRAPTPVMPLLQSKMVQNSTKREAIPLLRDPPREELFQPENQIQNNKNHSIDSQNVDDLKKEISKVRREIELLPQIDVVEQMQEIKVLLHDMMRHKYQKNVDGLNNFIVDIGIRLRTGGVCESLISHLSSWLSSLEDPKTNEELIGNPEKIK